MPYKFEVNLFLLDPTQVIGNLDVIFRVQCSKKFMLDNSSFAS